MLSRRSTESDQERAKGELLAASSVRRRFATMTMPAAMVSGQDGGVGGGRATGAWEARSGLGRVVFRKESEAATAQAIRAESAHCRLSSEEVWIHCQPAQGDGGAKPATGRAMTQYERSRKGPRRAEAGLLGRSRPQGRRRGRRTRSWRQEAETKAGDRPRYRPARSERQVSGNERDGSVRSTAQTKRRVRREGRVPKQQQLGSAAA
jgi:hypothetical protein